MKEIYTVQTLNQRIRHQLETELGRIWIAGEISNFTAATSGHWYFTLKDTQAQVRCVMFRPRNRSCRFLPQDGQQVQLRAQVTIYQPRGDLQLQVESIALQGDGMLQQQFEALKNQLQAEGLFAIEHKQAMPSVAKIGLITSATGAAIADVLNVLKRRAPYIDVVVYPSMVQGKTAASQLIEAIQTANKRQEVDVLLLTRGGGALEDLACFNDEALARIIYASALPIVSAVGHEVDFTIADFVADQRAPTPSAGAEMLSVHRDEWHQRLQQTLHRLMSPLQQRLQAIQNQLNMATLKLDKVHPQRQVQDWIQRLDEQQNCLHLQIKNHMLKQQKRQERGLLALQAATPQHRLTEQRQSIALLTQRLEHSLQDQIQSHHQRHAKASYQLHQLSPLQVLMRGYSATFIGSTMLKQTQQVQLGDTLTTRLHQGQLHSTITLIEPDPS
jgi:exodeoxyribonuclease VII large subunit